MQAGSILIITKCLNFVFFFIYLLAKGISARPYLNISCARNIMFSLSFYLFFPREISTCVVCCGLMVYVPFDGTLDKNGLGTKWESFFLYLVWCSISILRHKSFFTKNRFSYKLSTFFLKYRQVLWNGIQNQYTNLSPEALNYLNFELVLTVDLKKVLDLVWAKYLFLWSYSFFYNSFS